MKASHTQESRTFDVAVSPEVVTGRIAQYLKEAGYRPTGASEFQRGSARGTPFAFSPKKWHSVVGVQITPTAQGSNVAANFEIDTTGQMVTAREALFWENEISRFEAAARGEMALLPDAHAGKASLENKRSILVLLALFGAGAVLLCGMFFLPRPLLRYTRVVGGIIFLLAIWLWSKFQTRTDKKALVESGKLPPPPVHPS